MGQMGVEALNEASSLLASRPNENHSSGLVLLRRYRESQLTKWGVPPGWGLASQDFGGWVCHLYQMLDDHRRTVSWSSSVCSKSPVWRVSWAEMNRST